MESATTNDLQSQGMNLSAGTLRRRKRFGLQEPSTQIVDLACYSIALLIVVFRQPLAGHTYAITEILKLRVSMENLMVAGLCLALWSAALRLTERRYSAARELQSRLMRLLLQVSLCTTIVAIVLLVSRPRMVRPSDLGAYFVLSFLGCLFCRWALSAYSVLLQPVTRRSRSVLIVGSGPRGRHVASQLGLHPRWRYTLLGFVDPDREMQAPDVLGGLQELETLLSNNPIDEVIISLPIKSRYDEIQESIAICERVGVQSRYSTDLFETLVTKRRSFDHHDPSSVMLHMVHDTGLAIKRITDVAVALLLLILAAPLLTLIAVAIKLTSKGPIFFSQQRYGLNRRLFTMYKFRTMVVNAEHLQATLEHMNETEGPVFKIKRDPRITGIGEFLRKASLDELPQLWNVLKGDMSLVGPRPLPIRDVSRFPEAWLMRRFSVSPGITGLWQVSGRSNTNFDQWIQLDLDYIDQWSFLLDLHILVRTFSVVLRREGAV